MSDKNTHEALLAISRELNSVRETSLLLDRILDIALDALQAERGFILLKVPGAKSEFEAISARNISNEAITSIRELSSSVVNKVLSSGEAVLSVDAMEDQRFAGAESVLLQNIRSVACTPLFQEETLVGAIYVDNRMDSGQFDQPSLAFLQAFATQAASAIENAQIFEQLQSENEQLRLQLALKAYFPEIIGKSKPILEILQLIDDVADTSATVLVEGESGTGKELVARALHYHSSRKDHPFIPIFCGSLADSLLESELFGHSKGAFTGAIAHKQGLLEAADNGTLFLDEIADIDKNMQTKLLRVLQEGEIKRIGENKIRKINVRIIAATNKNLWEEVASGNFREDLFYRLNVINITMPPLRARQEDIPLLAEHFLKKFALENKKQLKGLAADARETLLSYHWPGNIRELENAVERAVILAREDQLTAQRFSLNRPQTTMHLIGKPLKEVEKFVILETLKQAGNNRTKTAEILDVSRRWLQYRLKEWGIRDED